MARHFSIATAIAQSSLSQTSSANRGTFPFRRVLHHEGLDFWLRPTSPFLVGFFFLIGRWVLRAIVRATGIAGEGRVADAYKAAFDLGLFAFSALACMNLAMLIYNHRHYYGLFDVYCDPYNRFWHKGFGGWTVVVYLSLYVELFGDAALSIFRGAAPSLLETMHKLAMIWITWGAVVTQSGWQGAHLLVGQGIRAFVRAHAAFDAVGVDLPGFHFLAVLRMLGFLVAVISTLPSTNSEVILGKQCATPASRFVAGFFQAYALLLAVLFAIIFKLKQRRKKTGEKAAKSQ